MMWFYHFIVSIYHLDEFYAIKTQFFETIQLSRNFQLSNINFQSVLNYHLNFDSCQLKIP